MNDYIRAQHKKFVPGDPSIFGAVDSYTLIQRIHCRFELLTGDKIVRAGKDSSERMAHIYPIHLKKPVQVADYITINSENWVVTFVSDSNKYVQIKAVQG